MQLLSILSLWLALSAGVFTTPPAGHARDSVPAPPVTLTLGTATVPIDTDVEVPISIGDLGGQAVLAYQIVITYDPSVVTALGHSTSGTLTSNWSTVSNVSTPGRVTLSAASATELAGSGTLVNLRFRSIAAGQSALVFTEAELNEGDPAANTQAGSVTVGVAEQPVLSVSPAQQNVTATSGTVAFTVENTGTGSMSWSATDNQGWVGLSPASGTLSAGVSQTLTATYQANTTTSQREASITVAAPGATGTPQVVRLVQAGEAEQPVLEVTPPEREVSASAGTTTYTVRNSGTGSMSWSASDDQGWVRLSPASGTLAGETSVSISAIYDANGTSSERVATVTVTAPGATGSPQTVTLRQMGSAVQLEAVDDTATTDEDVATTITVLDNDTGEGLSITSASGASNGTLSIVSSASAPDAVRYVPTRDFFGTDQFVYVVTSGGEQATATVRVTIRPINDAPQTVVDVATTPEDTALTVLVLLNDTDVEGDALSLIGIPEQPDHGVAAVRGDGQAVIYEPSADYVGEDVFFYTVFDGQDQAFGEVRVTVTGRNDGPVAVDDVASVTEDGSVAIDVLANDSDIDPSADLRVTNVFPPQHGTAVVDVEGDVVYTPEADYNGTDQFIYVIDDGQGPVGSPADLARATSTATVRVTISPVNDAPVANDDVASTGVDNPVNIEVLTNDIDVDGDMLSVSAAGGASFGQVSVSGGTVTVYTPNTGFTGQDSFQYSVSDGNGGTSQATVTITVSDLSPIARDDAATTDEDTAVSIDVLANDESRAGQTLSVSSASGASSGTVSVESGGTVLYTPRADFAGDDSFIYVVNDATGGASGTVTVTVTAINDAPTASTVVAPSGTLVLSGDDETPVPLAWSAATDADGDVVDYRWELASMESFATTLLTVTSSTTNAETTYRAIVDALATIGVGPNETVGVFQRVVSSDATTATRGTIASLTIERGVLTSGESSGPLAFSLSSAVPNPTRGTLTVLVDLPKSSLVRVEVFDQLGRQMHDMEAQASAGRDVPLALDLSALQPGIYTYRVTALLPTGDEVHSSRVTLIR